MLFKFNIFFLIIFSLIIFSGQSTIFALPYYNFWRVLQFLLFTFIALQFYFLSQKIEIPKVKIIIIISVILGLLSTFNAIEPLFSLLELIWHILFLMSFYVLTLQFYLNRGLAEKSIKILSLIPLLSIGLLPLAIFAQMQGMNVNWHQAFPNYRMLDDAVLPCLFFLWYWQYSTKNKFLKIILYIPTTLYLISFLFDGARANLLSIMISLTVILIFYKDKFKILISPLISLIIAICIYAIIYFNDVKKIGSSLNRYGSSGRAELWEKSLSLWLEYPILGIGGGNFINNEPKLFSAHPHNLILQWIAEWGLVGIFLTLGLFILTYKIISNYNKVPAFIFGFFIAFLVNILFSGTMIYPLSQTLNLWGLALITSYLLKQKDLTFTHQEKLTAFFIILFFSFTCIIIFNLYIADNEIVKLSPLPPRIWLDGTSPYF